PESTKVVLVYSWEVLRTLHACSVKDLIKVPVILTLEEDYLSILLIVFNRISACPTIIEHFYSPPSSILIITLSQFNNQGLMLCDYSVAERPVCAAPSRASPEKASAFRDLGTPGYLSLRVSYNSPKP